MHFSSRIHEIFCKNVTAYKAQPALKSKNLYGIILATAYKVAACKYFIVRKACVSRQV